MLSLSSLSIQGLYAVSALIFFASFGVFFLAIYKYYLTGKFRRIALDTVLFAALLLLLSFVTASRTADKLFYEIKLPFLIFDGVSVASLVYAVSGLAFEYKKSRNSLSSNSVKQALDNLNSAVCFFDETGRIVLINHTMLTLAYSLIGHYPKMQSEFEKFLKNDRFTSPDGRIWQFILTPLTEKGVEGFAQLTALDVTELVDANELLKKENSALSKTNDEIQLMLERLSDRIREQETLSLKMQIHNDIGTSLISLSGIMKNESNTGAEEQLKLLENAVAYFSSNKVNTGVTTLLQLKDKAASFGVELVVSGCKPATAAEVLIVSAAGECVTNCINHAKGSKVFVDITENESAYSVKISNNGIPPKAEITEGGGLSSLRRKIEGEGGTLSYLYSPEFSLNITIPKGE